MVEHRTRKTTKKPTAWVERWSFMSNWMRNRLTRQKLRTIFPFSVKKKPMIYCRSPYGLKHQGIPYQYTLKFPLKSCQKILAIIDPVSLDLLLRFNLVQKKFTRLAIKNIAMLSKKLNMAPKLMRKQRDLLERKVGRQYQKWLETMRRLTVTEKTETQPVAIRSRDVKRDCRPRVTQRFISLLKKVLFRTSSSEYQQLAITQHVETSSINGNLAWRGGSRSLIRRWVRAVIRVFIWRRNFVRWADSERWSWCGTVRVVGDHGALSRNVVRVSNSERSWESVLSGKSRSLKNVSDCDYAGSSNSSDD